jgi:hypothetical protein
MVVVDIDGDNDRNIITPGKTGLFLSENLTKNAKSEAAFARLRALARYGAAGCTFANSRAATT